MEQVEGELKPDRLHVGPLERRGDIHVHVEEPERFGFAFCLLHIFLFVCSPAHCTAMLGLLDLQLGEELDEPLEALLVPVDPEEVNLGSGGSGV